MLNRDFKEFCESLGARSVEYLLVGGYALAAHGHPRYTGDIDFWVRRTPQNLQQLVLALQDFGFASLALTPDDFLEDTVIQLGQPPNRIDLLTSLDGVDFDSCFARREAVELGGLTLWVIGREDLKINKRATGRAQDLADLVALESRGR